MSKIREIPNEPIPPGVTLRPRALPSSLLYRLSIFFSRLSPRHPPCSCIFCLLQPRTTSSSSSSSSIEREAEKEKEREKGREMKRVRDGCRKGVWARAGDNFIALVSSARLHRAEELPRATLRDHWRIIVREKGMGHPLFLPLPPLFLFLC